ncbi:hypothetical protein FGO68_gene17778 [Halteria grandinella]|uniref:Uncharacterized protein n=1 Tax=Halteria grandinella TaxID=5974 RepID=A0A8J8T3D7_HALGN|nr:hypothetical protein FGO68_gene17778 [Halteria grandinella]
MQDSNYGTIRTVQALRTIANFIFHLEAGLVRSAKDSDRVHCSMNEVSHAFRVVKLQGYFVSIRLFL